MLLDRKAIEKLNKKLHNGFKISLQCLVLRGEKWAELIVPYGKHENGRELVLVAHIYYDYKKNPALSVQTYQKEEKILSSLGNAKYKLLGEAQKRRNFNLLVQFTKDWDTEKIIQFWEQNEK